MYMEQIQENNLVLKPNDQLSDGIIYKFIQLREESKKLSEQFLNEHKFIRENIILLNGFRNRLTHDYDNVSYTFFYEIINNDLPKLKIEIISVLTEYYFYNLNFFTSFK